VRPRALARVPCRKQTASPGAAQTEQQRLARLMLSPQSLANAPGVREAQTALTAPTVTAGSFSRVPDHAGIAYPTGSRPNTYPPGIVDPLQGLKELKQPKLPPPVRRTPPRIDVPETLPSLSGPRNVDHLSPAQLSAGVPSWVPARHHRQGGASARPATGIAGYANLP
jgi:hypothetical protein